MKTFTQFLSEDAVADVTRSLALGLKRRLKGWDVSKNPGAVAIVDSEAGRVEEAKKVLSSMEGASGEWSKSKGGGERMSFRDVTVSVVDTGDAVKVIVSK